MKTMKTTAALVLAAVLALPALASDKALDEMLALRAPAGSPVKLGEWNGDLDACKKVADEYGIPMIAVWSREGCAHCAILERALTSPVFQEWAKTSGMVLGFSCTRDPLGVRQGPENGNGRYYWFCKRPDLISDYPFVRFYWYQNGTRVIDFSVKGDVVDRQQGIGADRTYNKAGQIVIDFIMNLSGFGDYEPRELTSYVGGTFALEETDGNRFEAGETTGEIEVELVRDEKAAKSATNNTVKVVSPKGVTVQTVKVDWAAGETNKTIKVDAAKMDFAKNGDVATLVAVAADGSAQSSNHVYYVAGEDSPENPLWIGERSAGSGASGLQSVRPLGADAPKLGFGEWTMDFDVATNLVASAEGDAYTLVLVEGSLWCHDCANAERNFTTLSDGSGNNRLKAWAAANQVALVALDIPNYDPSAGEPSSPTLLSRKAFATTLAYELPAYGMYDVSQGGAPAALTNSMMRSGLGYLTRKGVSDADAAAVLKRNFDLVSKDVSEGGFHSKADSRAYRTGVPIFVLLDKNGAVKARFTRFAAKSPLSADRANFDNYIKRFEEMIAIASGGHDDGGVLENDFPGAGATAFAANGGTASGEISHCDFQDVFKLSGVGGNALQKVTVRGVEGGADAQISVSFLKLESGTNVVVASASGSLKDGTSLEYTFTEAGDYYVQVSGGDIEEGDFTAASPKDANFAKYAIEGAVVYVPQEGRATGATPEGSDKIVIRLEKGQMYRIQGLDASAVAGVLDSTTPGDPYSIFYVALEDGDAVLTAQSKDALVTYQKWTPGTVGFKADGESVLEDAGEVKVAIVRQNGMSGEVKVRVSIDETKTDFYDSESNPRFTFEPVEIVWPDGSESETNVVVAIQDDQRFDGPGDIVLKAEIVSQENGDTVVGKPEYVISVSENDARSSGRVAFAGADPFYSKSKTVYVRESEGARIYADRIEASDGYVSVKVSASNGAVLGGAVTNGVVSWSNHKWDRKTVEVTGIPAGKSSKVTLSAPTDGLKILSASNTVTVVAVADDAPAFTVAEETDTLYRYVSYYNFFPVVLADGVEGAKLKFTKISGSLPAGLKVGYDKVKTGEEENDPVFDSLVVHGVTTAKPGVYTAVYQVVQQVGSKTTPGLTVRIEFTVADTGVEQEGAVPVPNRSFATSSTRVFKNLPVLDPRENRLAGTVQLTVKSTGVVSAKYVSAAGSVTLSAKGWDWFDPENGTLYAEAFATKAGYKMSVTCGADGAVTAILTDPAYDTDLTVESDGNIWSRKNSAEAWKGYYTVTLPFAGVVQEGVEGVAPRGPGYLTLKMNSASAWNTGTVTWAGMLPNGQTISGSAVLVKGDCWAQLPIFKASSRDVFSAVLKIAENAIEHKAANKCQAVFEDDGVKSWWIHTEKQPEFSYSVELDTYGGIYDPKENLAEACNLYYGTTEPSLSADVDGLGGWLFTGSGTPGAVEDVSLTITGASGSGAAKIAAGQANPQKFTFSLNRTTGVASGRFNLPYTDESGAEKTLTANWKGVVLVGWGPGCGCGDDNIQTETVLPFVNGAYWISEKAASGKTSVTVKRGGSVGAK